ncbi:MAG: ATP-dependent helicase UvrD/PcrA [Actinomycetota bacterium]|nr:ATP-dependent helicase UvrD/PcrA [Actinomycetota bacterium]
MDEVTLTLDAAQAEAVSIHASERQIVLAGPGSGKTEVVAALVSHLVDDEGLSAPEELLVISFSRAAVEAVARRVRDAVGRSGTSVCTLDSLATRILGTQAGTEWESTSFDERIRRAAAEVAQHGFDLGEQLYHVVVDEVQDIVGDRAALLLALLAALPDDTGFTLLGDPAQAIYDFQLEGNASLTSQDLLAKIQELGGVTVRELTGQYRARTRDAHGAARLRDEILTGDGVDAVDDFAAGVTPIASVEELVPLVRRWAGSTAILTRTNGEALLVADALDDFGVLTAVRAPASEQHVAPWLGQMLADRAERVIDRATFAALAAETRVPRPPDDVWLAARSLSDARTPVVETPRLAARLAAGGAIPVALTDTAHTSLVVSTIHRAKGLEFDNVVIVDHKARENDDEQAEARASYVALTRARALIARVRGPETWNLRRDERTRRWIKRGRERWQTTAIEIRGSDLDRTAPAGTDLALSQSRIRGLQPGSELTMRFDPRKSFDLPVYDVYSDDVLVGCTSQAFGADLVERVGPASTRKRGYPSWPFLAGARVAAIETVCGPPTGDGVGRWGMWLGVRPTGLLAVRWKDDVDA